MEVYNGPHLIIKVIKMSLAKKSNSLIIGIVSGFTILQFLTNTIQNRSSNRGMLKHLRTLFCLTILLCLNTRISFAQSDPCLDCNVSCYEPYFMGLDIPDSLKCAYATNAERYIENLSELLYDFRNPLWSIHQNGEWVIYFYIESWVGPVTDTAIMNLRNEYELLANQWLEGLTDFDPSAPDTVSIKVFGFVFQDSVEIDASFYNTYGNYPIVTHSEASEYIPWILSYPDGTETGFLPDVIDFDSLEVTGNDAANFPSATFSPTNWNTYTHPEGVDMPYTRFGHKTDWYAVGGREYLWIGGLISDYSNGETTEQEVFAHEMGHCFFHDDLYDNVKYPCADGLISVMNGYWGDDGPDAYHLEQGTYITGFDRVIMRIVWEAQKYGENLAIDPNCDSLVLGVPVHEFPNSTINIYPNPAIDVINIDVSDNLKYEATIYDLLGRLKISTTNQSVIDVQTLPEGIYLIVIKDLDSGQRVIEKIIRKNK